MNRTKTVNEVVRVLLDQYTDENIYPEHEKGIKAKPCLIVAATDEEGHESICGASTITLELTTAINDTDGGGINMEAVSAFIQSAAFKDELNLGGVLTAHRVEFQGSEIEREDTTTNTMITALVWVYS